MRPRVCFASLQTSAGAYRAAFRTHTIDELTMGSFETDTLLPVFTHATSLTLETRRHLSLLAQGIGPMEMARAHGRVESIGLSAGKQLWPVPRSSAPMPRPL